MDGNLKFSDGFSCFYAYSIRNLANCYMEYFGFDHTGGFNGPQRSVLDLEPIFGFVKNYTGCDLINEPNSKCKRKRKKGKWRPYIDRNGDSSKSSEFPDKVPVGLGIMGRLKVKSKHNFVTIFYKEDDECEDESMPFERHFPGDDGPDFPLPLTEQESFKVEKRGRVNPKYKIEINAERVIKYSGVRKESSDESPDSSSSASYEHHDSTHKTIHVPLHFEDGCTLWKGGSTEETSHREREHKDTKKLSKTKKKPVAIKKKKVIVKQKTKKKAKLIKKTKTAESSEIMTTTEVALEAPKRKTFIDWILPPGVRRAV
ncbi:hypothetical protein Ddc_24183 [Ditylenchus destructor]|nr:hypothetical protein Ddc_24183 [Ditylenchus destructor]